MILVPPTPPTHVIVDQIPVTPGLPLWLTTTISAGIGALFGIVSGSLMEVVKPAILRAFLRRRMRPQLLAEFRGNVLRARMIAGDRQQPSDETVLAHALYLIANVDQQRFKYYMDNEPLAVYELDENKYMQGFYTMVYTQLPTLIQGVQEQKASMKSVWGVILNAVEFGEHFLDRKG